MIIDLSNLYKGVPVGSGFGDEEFSAGLGAIVNDSLMSAGYIDEGPMIEAANFQGSAGDFTTHDFYLAVEGQGT